MQRFGALSVWLGMVFTSQAADAPSKEQIEKDLRLQVDAKNVKVLQAGTSPRLVVELVNTSKTVTYPVVKPGDGSEMGWREPHLYWTAIIDRGDGKPSEVPQARYARCGLFAWDWPKDASRLKPGEKLSMRCDPFLECQLVEFQRAGHVRLQAHYAYRAGKGKKGGSGLEGKQLGLMEGVPAFEIVSAAVLFDVVRPLDVRVKVKRALKVHVKTSLSDLLEVTLVNQSKEAIEVSSPTLHANARVGFEIEGEFAGWSPDLSEQQSSYGIRRALKPGEAIPLIGPDRFANGLDGSWEYPVEGKVRLRAMYITTTWQPRATILSEWVEVRVEK